jgi:hypothetical protein
MGACYQADEFIVAVAVLMVFRLKDNARSNLTSF